MVLRAGAGPASMTACRRLKVVRLLKPKVADDTRFIATLVWMLEHSKALFNSPLFRCR